tara:strand:- start:187 stop:1590 length:1404 start_codon:yes stop_codon:yes gene_type:complete
MNDKKKVTIVIPVFSLKKERLINFLFICKELSKLENNINVVITEQCGFEKQSSIFEYLKIYPNFTYIKTKIGDVFNKSILINRATEEIDTEYIWIMDSDFYTNYKYILANIQTGDEFIRPFSETIELSKSETDYLLKTSYIKITRDSYTSSSANGKYSFIIRNDIFKVSGGMNENFKGWGFQDLDFVENRLKTTKIKSIDIIGLHLYHEKASREFVNQNKLIYMSMSDLKLQDKSKSTEYNTSDYNIPHTLNQVKQKKVENKVEGYKKNTNIFQKTPVYKCDHINVSYKSNPFFSTFNDIKIIKAQKQKISNRNLVGNLKVNTNYENFLYKYIEFISNNYNKIDQFLLLTNDYFFQNPKIFSSKVKGDIEKYAVNTMLEKKFKFLWMGETNKTGHFKNAKYVEDFVNENLKCKIISREYSPSGCILVSDIGIKSKPQEYYSTLEKKMKNWTSFEFEMFLYFFSNIFG